jgi:hypothetical protein
VAHMSMCIHMYCYSQLCTKPKKYIGVMNFLGDDPSVNTIREHHRSVRTTGQSLPYTACISAFGPNLHTGLTVNHEPVMSTAHQYFHPHLELPDPEPQIPPILVNTAWRPRLYTVR